MERSELRKLPSGRADDRYVPFAPSADIAMAVALGLIRPTDSVLEVGCGLGGDAAFLAQVGCSVTAIDTSPASVNLAKSIYSDDGDVDFIRGSTSTVRAMAQRGLRFDVVSDRLVLSNLSGPALVRSYVTSVARVLKPGGLFFLRYGDPSEAERGAIRDLRRTFVPDRDDDEAETGKVVLQQLREHFEPVAFQRRTQDGGVVDHPTRPTNVLMLPARGGYHADAVVMVWSSRLVAGAAVPKAAAANRARSRKKE